MSAAATGHARRGAFALLLIDALCLPNTALTAPKASPHDRLMGQCLDQGGVATIKNGVERCCARIPNPAPNGPKGYCVACSPPGSNNCDVDYTMRPATTGAPAISPGGAQAN